MGALASDETMSEMTHTVYAGKLLFIPEAKTFDFCQIVQFAKQKRRWGQATKQFYRRPSLHDLTQLLQE